MLWYDIRKELLGISFSLPSLCTRTQAHTQAHNTHPHTPLKKRYNYSVKKSRENLKGYQAVSVKCPVKKDSASSDPGRIHTGCL